MDAVGDEDCACGKECHSDYGAQGRGSIEKSVASGQDEYHADSQVQVFPVPVLKIVEHQCQHSEDFYDKQGSIVIIQTRDKQGVDPFVRSERHKECHKKRKKKVPTPTPPTPPTPPSPTPTPTPPVLTPTPTPNPPAPTPTPPGPAPLPPVPPQPSPSTEVLTKGKFTFAGVNYTIKVVPGNESNELFWNDYAQIGNQTIVCKVNLEHPFFTAFGKPDKSTLQLIKALSIAKYKTINDEGGSVTDMMNEFNDIINNQSVSDE